MYQWNDLLKNLIGKYKTVHFFEDNPAFDCKDLGHRGQEMGSLENHFFIVGSDDHVIISFLWEIWFCVAGEQPVKSPHK